VNGLSRHLTEIAGVHHTPVTLMRSFVIGHWFELLALKLLTGFILLFDSYKFVKGFLAITFLISTYL